MARTNWKSAICICFMGAKQGYFEASHSGNHRDVRVGAVVDLGGFSRLFRIRPLIMQSFEIQKTSTKIDNNKTQSDIVWRRYLGHTSFVRMAATD